MVALQCHSAVVVEEAGTAFPCSASWPGVPRFCMMKSSIATEDGTASSVEWDCITGL